MISKICLMLGAIMASNIVGATTLSSVSDKISVDGIVGDVNTNSTIPFDVTTGGSDVRLVYVVSNNKSIQLDPIVENNTLARMTNYVSGKTPFFRGTLSQGILLADLVQNYADLQPIAALQLSKSDGGSIVSTSATLNLCDPSTTIATTEYGPHTFVVDSILRDNGCSLVEANIEWVVDLTESVNSPLSRLRQKSSDAATLISPDIGVATGSMRGSGIGDGSDDSVLGARVLTKLNNNTIKSDMIFVRRDYVESSRNIVGGLMHKLLIAEETMESGELKDVTYDRIAKTMFRDGGDRVGVRDLYNTEDQASFVDNADFFLNPSNPTNFRSMVESVSVHLIELGLIESAPQMDWANWNFESFKHGIKNTKVSFDESVMTAAIANRLSENVVVVQNDSQYMEFPIYFLPKVRDVDLSKYDTNIQSLVDLVANHTTTEVNIEGHCDPLEYQKVMLKDGYAESTYSMSKKKVAPIVRQSCKEAGLLRAMQIRDAIIKYANVNMSTNLDYQNIEVSSVGLSKPVTGFCDDVPCPIKSKEDWLKNMRVVISVRAIDAESSEFELIQ